MPYMNGNGIRDVYEITKVRTITSKEAKQDDDEGGNDIRLAFELKFSRRQFADYQPIDTSRMINYTFIDTAFDKLDECVGMDRI